MKRCFKCGLELPREAFYGHPQMADGLLGKCKECTKRDVRLNYAAKRERYISYEKARAMATHRVIARREYLLTERGKAARRRAAQNSNRRYPEKSQARSVMTRAIKKGPLRRQPCEVCGNPKSQGHHPDYSKPLEVRWLCARHHAHAHGRALERTA